MSETDLKKIEITDQVVNDLIGFSDSINHFMVKSTKLFSSISEIFMALLSGSKLAIPNKSIISDHNQFGRYLEYKNASVITLPPTY